MVIWLVLFCAQAQQTGGSQGLGGGGHEECCGQPICKEDGLMNSATFPCSKVGFCERCFSFL